MAQAEAQRGFGPTRVRKPAPAHFLADQDRLAQNAARPFEHDQVRLGAPKARGGTAGRSPAR